MSGQLLVGTVAGLVSAAEKGSLGDLIKPLRNEIFLFETFVAGTSYLQDESVLHTITVGDGLTLQREDNKFDRNAIIILHDGKKIGYVPEKDNVVFSRLMDAGKMLTGKVAAIAKPTGYTRITVKIYLVDF